MACHDLACKTTSLVPDATIPDVITTFIATETVTRRIVTTCVGSPGQTITITPPLPTTIPPSTFIVTPPVATLTNITPVYTTLTSSYTDIIPAPTVTLNEIVIVLQDTNGNIYTTTISTLPAATSTLANWTPATPVTVVIGHKTENGWNTWSNAEKGGLIAGCVVIFLILVLFVLYWCLRRRQTWIANDWHVNSHPGFIPGHQYYGQVTAFPWLRGGGRRTSEQKGRVRNWFRRDGTKEEGYAQTPQSQPGDLQLGHAPFYQPRIHDGRT